VLYVPDKKGEKRAKPRMNVIIYSKEENSLVNRLRAIIEASLAKDRIETFKTINKLKERILQPVYGCIPILIVIAKEGDLIELLSIINSLRSRVRIILILPDSKPETIKMGYKLEPRLLSVMGGELSVVQAVLEKMLKEARRKWRK
jgi:hypothetical protein